LEEEKFLILSQLFDSLGIIEKGIEKIYHHLLKNKKIENLNEVCGQYGLSLKRGYKICSVLNELGLVLIYDRPMKILLQSDVIPLWQEIVNLRIENLQKEFQEQKKKCEMSLEEFFKAYDLKEKEIQEPVEFYNLNIPNFSEILRNYKNALKKCCIALGIHYENPFVSLIREKEGKQLQDILYSEILPELHEIKEKIKNLDIKIVINEELFLELIQSKEFKILNELITPLNIKFKKIELWITESNFSNFSLTDDELIQPSFDPTNKLIGCYISRNKNIYQIFYDKFNELCENGIILETYAKSKDIFESKPISSTDILTLSLL